MFIVNVLFCPGEACSCCCSAMPPHLSFLLWLPLLSYSRLSTSVSLLVLSTEQLDFSCETEEEMHYIVAGFRAMVSQSVGAGAGSSAFGSQSWVRKSAR